MAKTLTIYVDLQRLQASGDSSSLIVQLMMACNDISLANQCLSNFRDEVPPIRRHIQRGALIYFIRLQCGHLNEAMKLIKEIQEDKHLLEKVKRCRSSAQDSFLKLCNCLKGGPDYKKFEQYVGRIRHNTVFHYDKTVVQKALSDRANRAEARQTRITFGDHISLCRFDLADEIVDSVICRQIWKIPKNVDLRKYADEYSDFGADLCKSYLVFCGEFIGRYVQEHAAI
jgi:hypothetical protein